MTEDSRSLSELLKQVKQVLDTGFPDTYWVVAEILELHENRTGHCYLELIEKDSETESLLARARATIWASRYAMLRPYFEASTGTKLRSGIKLLVRAKVEFHAQYGFSLNISDIDPAYTLGDLARKKQEVIRKLREDGVMEMNKEVPFPRVPQRIGVISSESAAGYGDFLESLKNNPHGFLFHTRLFPAVMQGTDVPASIMAALDKLFESDEQFDCVAIIRGGGAKADLESFNDYELSYFITQFPLPILTGIGHERDESVVDMVAAAGLKTPTAVAEFLVDQALAFEFSLSAYYDRLQALVKQTVQSQGALLERYESDRRHLVKGFLQYHREWLVQSRDHLEREVHNLYRRKEDQLTLLETRTKLVDPANILKRGYSITTVEGRSIRNTSDVKTGDKLVTRLHDGEIHSTTHKTIQSNGKGKN